MSKKVEEIDLDYELGNMVGEYIIYRFLPTLSTDMIKSMNTIPVSLELEREWAVRQTKRTKIYFDSTLDKKVREEEGTRVFNDNLAWYKENIESVFLPPVLECRIPKFQYKNEENFIKGLKMALWDCDMSHYDVMGIEIKNGDGWWCTDVNLKYAK